MAETLVSWASRFLRISAHEFERSYGTAPEVQDSEVLVTELDKGFLRGMYAPRHQTMSDEPKTVGVRISRYLDRESKIIRGRYCAKRFMGRLHKSFRKPEPLFVFFDELRGRFRL